MRAIVTGQVGNESFVTNDGAGRAVDQILVVPAAGRNGITPLRNFLE